MGNDNQICKIAKQGIGIASPLDTAAPRILLVDRTHYVG